MTLETPRQRDYCMAGTTNGRCNQPVAFGRPNKKNVIVTKDSDNFTAGIFCICEDAESGLCYYHDKKARGLFDTTPEMHRRKHRGEVQIGYLGRNARVLNFI